MDMKPGLGIVMDMKLGLGIVMDMKLGLGVIMGIGIVQLIIITGSMKSFLAKVERGGGNSMTGNLTGIFGG